MLYSAWCSEFPLILGLDIRGGRLHFRDLGGSGGSSPCAYSSADKDTGASSSEAVETASQPLPSSSLPCTSNAIQEEGERGVARISYHGSTFTGLTIILTGHNTVHYPDQTISVVQLT